MLIKYLAGCSLPPVLEHGIPCAMPANPDSLPWGQNDCPPGTLEQLNTIATLCDLKFSFGNVFVSAQSCFRDVLFNLPQLSVYNARHFFAHLRGSFGDLDLALPTFVEAQPHATCATYTDGSLTSPTRPEWSLAGIRIVHNQRTSEIPLHSNESIVMGRGALILQ